MSDHELGVELLIDAPVEAVWRAWTEHGAEWLCPPPWRAEVIEQELRPGGRSRMVFHGPAGETMPIDSVVLAVDPGRRIVATDAFDADWNPRGPTIVRIDTFEAQGDRTRYTATARHWTAEAKERHAAVGFEAGWRTSAEQLAAVARRLAAS